jgi:hypothetical protein
MPARKKTGANDRINVGDRVSVLFGVRWVPAVVVEDRGNLGVGGRRILGIQQVVPADEEMGPYEVPEEYVRKRRRGTGRQAATPSKGRR